MKISNLAGFILLTPLSMALGRDATALPNGTSGTNSAALPVATAFHEVNRGANHRTWQRETYEQGPNGKVITHVHKYTELTTGMNYQDANGNWAQSQELIEPFQNGAVARHGRHQVVFSNNLNSHGSVGIRMPDGRSMDINVLGLAFYDTSSGNSVMLGEVQDSQGELISSNQVLYPNAFSGVSADVRYTYRLGGFEQDVILRGQLPDPSTLGLNPETTKLEVMTEFLNPPQEKIVDHSNFKHPSLDEDVSLGSMVLGHGKAFDLGDQKPYWDGTSVAKRYITTEDGRKVLLEMIPWKNVVSNTSHLPKQAGIQPKRPILVAKNPPLPGTPATKSAQNPIKLSSITPLNQGYVLDYVLLNAATNNFTFQSDTTYLISGGVSFNGTTIFEGGTCIKSSSSIGSQLQLYGPALCKASEYRPIVFTSQNDNSVGESISSGTNSIALNEFSMDAAGDDVVMEHVRCSYCDVGVHPTCNTFRLTDAQFFNCYRPICPEYVNCQFNNVLIVNCTNVFWGGLYTVEGSHFTVDGCQQFTDGWDDSSDDNITLTNSLLVGINGYGYAPVATDHTVQLSSDAGVFQTAGGGGYYLATNSPYRGAGTPNIDPGFLADIANKTTYPPLVYFTTNIFWGSNLTLYAQAQRDTNSNPDLGYHYDPLDYIFGPTYLTNATISASAGTAIGVFATNVWTYGLMPANNAQFLSQGTPNNLNHIVQFNTVQESNPPGWKECSYGSVANFNGTNWVINCRFTDWTSIGLNACHVQLGQYSPLGLRDCQFHDGSIKSYTTSINLTNCLLDRVNVDVEPGDASISSWRNNTFWNGTFGFGPGQNNSVVTDNLFDGTVIPDWMFGWGMTYTGGHNAYVTNCNTIDPTLAGDIILTNSPAYQLSWLGNYYIPTGNPLVNAGSTTADQVGLYHFTTQTNQVQESNGIVDIGYHYVATDAYGNPVASNTNGIADYVQYPNGTPPSILVQPTNHTATVGDEVFFAVVATGFPAPTFQWYFNGTIIVGATNSVVELDGVGTNNVGSYFVTASNCYGAVSSWSVLLTNLTTSSSYTVAQGSLTNYLFQGDTTYYVDSTVQLYGTTTIEGGAVIKFGNHAKSQLILNGPLNCLTAEYRPALLTSRDDNSSGSAIHQSTGNPTNYYLASYLVGGSTQTNAYRNFRIKFAGTGIAGTSAVNVWDSQFINCGTAVSNGAAGSVGLHNVLISVASNCVITTGSIGSEFLTADQCQGFCPVSYTGANLTNSILTAVANTNGIKLVSSVWLSSGTGVYQSAGGGAYYLAAHAYQQSGITNMGTGILGDIAGKTTWPPIVYNIPGNYFSTNLNLTPRAFRDLSSTPDFGYHYDPLDYILGSMCVTNASIVVNAGTAVGIYCTNRVYYGLAIANNANLLINGLANQLAHIVEYNTVQEQNPPGWQMPGDGNISQFGGTNYQMSCRFADWSCMAQDAPHVWCDGYMQNNFGLTFQNCQFHGGSLVTWFQSLFFTNCLFERVNCDLEPGDQFIPVFCNNTVFGGTFGYSPWTATNAVVCNNLFDRASIPDELAGWGWPWYSGSHNAYVTNYQTLDPVSPTDLILTSPPTYQSSWLGSYYLSPASPLINAGSTTADQFGLYYYTTQTNQVPETNSVVDIGYHYVATDGFGNPMDSNHDGIPDYLDVVPLWQAADPNNLSAGRLNVIIDSPAQGVILQ